MTANKTDAPLLVDSSKPKLKFLKDAEMPANTKVRCINTLDSDKMAAGSDEGELLIYSKSSNNYEKIKIGSSPINVIRSRGNLVLIGFESPKSNLCIFNTLDHSSARIETHSACPVTDI